MKSVKGMGLRSGWNWFALGLANLVLIVGASSVGAQSPGANLPQETAPTEQASDSSQDEATKKRYADFEQMLRGVKLTGRFSVLGRDEGRASNEEEYYITRVTKSEEGDFWVFNARIKYGDNDYTVPLPIEVKWAGDTPVVTMTDFTILGQGPFSARVVFYEGKYAGTWSHGEVNGHLIGTYEKADAPRD